MNLSPASLPPLGGLPRPAVRHRGFGWLLIAAYYVLTCSMHLEVSLWLVRQRSTMLGNMSYSELVPGIVAAAALAMVMAIALQLRRSPRPRLTAGYWLLWLAGILLVDRYLTFSMNEYAHYPQYAILAWLLARVMDPDRTRWTVGRVLFWTTLLGAGDELSQYLWVTVSYSHYYDFNDSVVNLLGAMAGVLLYYGAADLPRRVSPEKLPRVEFVASMGLVVLVAFLLQADLMALKPDRPVPPGGIVQLADHSRRLYLQRSPGFYASWQPGPHRGTHYVLPPVTGLGLVVAMGIVFAGFRPRRR